MNDEKINPGEGSGEYPNLETPPDATSDAGDQPGADDETPWELDAVAPGTGTGETSAPNDDDSVDGPEGDGTTPSRRIPAFGEIVSKRHPILIALVMLFALFLAVAPFLFRYERNMMHEAVVVYTNVCEARENGRLTDDWLKSVSGPALLSTDSAGRAAFVNGMECLDAKSHSFALRLVAGHALGPNRAYVLSVFKGADIKKAEKSGAHVANFYFPMDGDRLVIDVMPGE